MVVTWRVVKKRHAPYDGSGAMQVGGRWNSPGRPVIYASDSYAGAILEILAHALRPRTLPGPHHAVRIDVPEDQIEVLHPLDLPGWESKGLQEARGFGDRWLREKRSAALIVPAVTARPIGRLCLINPQHPAVRGIRVSEPFNVPWDERIF